MTCRRCKRVSENLESGACPFCGEVNPPAQSGMVRTSSILIAAGEGRKVYRSVEEVPPRLRQKLLRSTSGLNSATILIADRKGREELARAIRNLPGLAHQRLRAALSPESGGSASPIGVRTLKALGAGLAILCAVFVWLVFTHRW